jgi:protein phosphatase
MDVRMCPNCGHENLPRAVFCFKCGNSLDNPPIVRGIHRQRRHVEDAIRYVKRLDNGKQSDLIHYLREAKAKLPPPIDETPITCLRCGTLNMPLAGYCIGCGGALSLSDTRSDTQLIPRASARTDVGNVRDNNEDRVGLWARDGVVLAMIADGMGGAVAGEEASRLVLEAIQADFLGEARGSETLHTLTEDEISDKLRYAVRRANWAVIQRASDHPELHGMGTTITLAFVRNDRVIIAHVGDSRAYLVDGKEGWINQITDDHSFVEALVAAGHITAEQAAVHPMRNVLYRALGQLDETDADLYSRNLSAGDWLILCSDGLTRHVDPAEIAETANHSAAPDEVAQHLIRLANKRGGEDNISVIAILMENAEDIEADPPPDSIVFLDTEIGLFQAPLDDEDYPERKTLELPSVEPNNDDDDFEER